MATTDTANGRHLKPGDRVIVTRSLRGAPEGTAGKVKVANGLTWARYWVQFDNGLWLGSVSASDLVREGDWEEFKRRRAEEAARPKTAEPAPAAAPAGAGEVKAAGGAASKVPAHLLERSQQARARKSAG